MSTDLVQRIQGLLNLKLLRPAICEVKKSKSTDPTEYKQSKILIRNYAATKIQSAFRAHAVRKKLPARNISACQKLLEADLIELQLQKKALNKELNEIRKTFEAANRRTITSTDFMSINSSAYLQYVDIKLSISQLEEMLRKHRASRLRSHC